MISKIIRYTTILYILGCTLYHSGIQVWAFLHGENDVFKYVSETAFALTSFIIGLPGSLILLVAFVVAVGSLFVASIGWIFTGEFKV